MEGLLKNQLIPKVSIILLVIIEIFVTITAIIGGVGLINNGIGIPKVWLNNSPFSSFLIPGFVLLFVVGGTNLLALFSIWKRWFLSPELSAVAGFGILIWIFTQLYLIRQASFLQIFYFGIGVLILALSIILLRFSKN